MKPSHEQDIKMDATIDDVLRQVSAARSPVRSPLKSPVKRDHSPQMSSSFKNLLSPKEKMFSPPPRSSGSSSFGRIFDDDEAAKILVSMSDSKPTTPTTPSPVISRGRGRPRKPKPESTGLFRDDNMKNNENPFHSPLSSSFPKPFHDAGPTLSPPPSIPSIPSGLSMSMAAAQNKLLNPTVGIPTPPLFGHQSFPSSIPGQPQMGLGLPVINKPKTLAEKKALPPEIQNIDLDKVVHTKQQQKKNQKEKELKEKGKFKSKKLISDSDSSDSETDKSKMPKINIKLGKGLDKHKEKGQIKDHKKEIKHKEDEPKKKRGPKKKVKDEPKTTTVTVTTETITINEGDEKVWICPSCKRPDDGSPMIGCDTCDDWYHYTCAGIKDEPGEDESWFCKKCISKQQQIESKFTKKKETKKRVKDK